MCWFIYFQLSPCSITVLFVQWFLFPSIWAWTKASQPPWPDLCIHASRDESLFSDFRWLCFLGDLNNDMDKSEKFNNCCRLCFVFLISFGFSLGLFCLFGVKMCSQKSSYFVHVHTLRYARDPLAGRRSETVADCHLRCLCQPLGGNAPQVSPKSLQLINRIR